MSDPNVPFGCDENGPMYPILMRHRLTMAVILLVGLAAWGAAIYFLLA